jgi:hypothetical protein
VEVREFSQLLLGQTPKQNRNTRSMTLGSVKNSVAGACQRLLDRCSRSLVSFSCVGFFVPIRGFPQRNFAPGSPRNDDRQPGRSTASPISSLLKRIALFQSGSLRSTAFAAVFICLLPKAAVPELEPVC